jgi:hypothetical protein
MAAAGTTKKELTPAEQLEKALGNLGGMGRNLNGLVKVYKERNNLARFLRNYEDWQEDFEEVQGNLDKLIQPTAPPPPPATK